MDGHGVPLSLVVSGANLNDCKGLEPVLDSIRIDDDHPAKMRRDLLLAKTHPASFSTAQLYR